MTKKMLAFILAMITVASCFSATTVFGQTADEDYEIQPRMTYISTVVPSFNIKGLKAYAAGVLCAKVSTSLKIELQLQKKSGDTYSPVKTWNKSGTGTSLSLSGEATINPLSTYRLRAYFSAGGETMTDYLTK